MDGQTAYKCSECGDEYQVRIPETGHTFNIAYDEIVSELSCTTDKVGRWYCQNANCNFYEDRIIEERPGHNYESEIIDPTCTEAGYTKYTCVNCGDFYTDAYTEALGHEFNPGVYDELISQVSCTTDGVGRWKCLRPECDGYEDRVFESAHGHDMADANCTEPMTCKVCGHTEGEAFGHNWEWDTFAAPTCEAPGYDLYTCARCGAHKEVASDPSLHDQLQPGEVCSVCGYQAPIHGS